MLKSVATPALGKFKRPPLLATPLPLVDRDRRLIVLWSPKSACTATYVWFSCLCGFLDHVRQYDAWPHNHRVDVYRFSERYQSSVEADTSNFYVVRIIRDPYARAVSIFREALVGNFADKDAAAAGLSFDTGISFREFLRLAERKNMGQADPHYRPQLHPFESQRQPDTIVNVSKSNLFSELNGIEKKMGWPVTDFKSMQWFHELESARRARPHLSNEKRLFNAPIVRGDPPRETAFPDYDRLLTPNAKRRIEQIYHVDFEAYRDYL